MSEFEYTYVVTVQAADGRERVIKRNAPTSEQACNRALRDAKRDAPIDSTGRASGWRVLSVV